PNYYNNLSGWDGTNIFYEFTNRAVPLIFNIRFNISNNYEYYKNYNSTQTYGFSKYNLTNALIYFSNGSVACSDISTCDNNINITLTPNNASYVLDNFNLTEGVSRTNSPITLTGNNNQKSVGSTLTEGIKVATKINIQNCDIDYIFAIGKTYSPSYWTCDSSANVLTFNLDIPAGGTTLTIDYDTYVPGTGDGGITPPTLNPQSILTSYPNEWQQKRTVQVNIEIRNKDGEKYQPTSLSFNFNITGITFLEQNYNEELKFYENFFEVTEEAELGDNSITVFANDEKTIENQITFKVVPFDKDSPYEPPEPPTPDKITWKDWVQDNLW
ncbi:unnamed protein product, partial [marine sediment metagenome]